MSDFAGERFRLSFSAESFSVGFLHRMGAREVYLEADSLRLSVVVVTVEKEMDSDFKSSGITDTRHRAKARKTLKFEWSGKLWGVATLCKITSFESTF